MDEVDRMLDMGFKQQVDQIISCLPRKVQTLLFSATISKSMKDLARVKLGSSDPEYIQIHDFDTIESRTREENQDDDSGDTQLK